MKEMINNKEQYQNMVNSSINTTYNLWMNLFKMNVTE
jgi:hypothetical protein